MLFLDHTQIKYCKIKKQDETISGVIYNNNLFIRDKAFPREEIETAIKECREEYLDHVERTNIPTLLIKEKNSVGIWLQNNQYKAKIVSGSDRQQSSTTQATSVKSGKSKDLSRISIRQLASQMRAENGVEIKTRRYKLKLYQRCFLGNEAVAWIANQAKITPAEAIAVGQKMIDKNIFHHVLDEHEFKDEETFYRFYEDEGKSIWNSSL